MFSDIEKQKCTFNFIFLQELPLYKDLNKLNFFFLFIYLLTTSSEMHVNVFIYF